MVCVNILRCQCGTHYIPQRYIMCIMTFLGVVLGYTMRSCFNVAITKMVKRIEKESSSTSNTTVDSANSEYECEDNNPPAPKLEGGEYDWSEGDQSTLLNGFLYGYAACHFPSGFLSDHFGGKHIFSGGIVISGIASILIPLSVKVTSGDIWAPLILRIVQGVAQSAVFTASMALIGLWAPRTERSTIGSIVMTGPQVGSVLGNWLTSVLITGVGSWAFPFYFWGGLAVVWYFFYVIMVYSEPSQCPFITEDEAAYLEKEIGARNKMKIPLWKILTSCPVWAITAASVGHDVIFFFLSVQYPKYLYDVLHFTLEEVGLHTALPYILLYFCSNVSALFCDYFIRKETCSILNVRRIFCSIGSLTPAIFLILAVYMGCNRMVAVACIYLCLGTMGPYYPGLRVNTADLTKNFGGIVMALTNGMGVLVFIPFPHIAGWMTSEHTPHEWIPIFWLMFVIAVVTNFIFVIFGQAERQSWDFPEGA